VALLLVEFDVRVESGEFILEDARDEALVLWNHGWIEFIVLWRRMSFPEKQEEEGNVHR
jgi:hypothetical protein